MSRFGSRDKLVTMVTFYRDLSFVLHFIFLSFTYKLLGALLQGVMKLAFNSRILEAGGAFSVS